MKLIRVAKKQDSMHRCVKVKIRKKDGFIRLVRIKKNDDGDDFEEQIKKVTPKLNSNGLKGPKFIGIVGGEAARFVSQKTKVEYYIMNKDGKISVMTYKNPNYKGGKGSVWASTVENSVDGILQEEYYAAQVPIEKQSVKETKQAFPGLKMLASRGIYFYAVIPLGEKNGKKVGLMIEPHIHQGELIVHGITTMSGSAVDKKHDKVNFQEDNVADMISKIKNVLSSYSE